MNINVLNKQYQRIAVVDTFTSLMWCKRYYDVGALDLQIEATIENLKIFKKHYFITRDDDTNVYRIEAIEIDTNEDGDDVLLQAVRPLRRNAHPLCVRDDDARRGGRRRGAQLS